MGSPLSREAVVAAGNRLTVLGGITPAGTSLAQVSSIDPRTGGGDQLRVAGRRGA